MVKKFVHFFAGISNGFFIFVKILEEKEYI
jgi:hypothetical protein